MQEVKSFVADSTVRLGKEIEAWMRKELGTRKPVIDAITMTPVPYPAWSDNSGKYQFCALVVYHTE